MRARISFAGSLGAIAYRDADRSAPARRSRRVDAVLASVTCDAPRFAVRAPRVHVDAALEAFVLRLLRLSARPGGSVRERRSAARAALAELAAHGRPALRRVPPAAQRARATSVPRATESPPTIATLPLAIRPTSAAVARTRRSVRSRRCSSRRAGCAQDRAPLVTAPVVALAPTDDAELATRAASVAHDDAVAPARAHPGPAQLVVRVIGHRHQRRRRRRRSRPARQRGRRLRDRARRAPAWRSAAR